MFFGRSRCRREKKIRNKSRFLSPETGNAAEMIPSINFRSLSLCLEFESDENLDEDFVEKIFDAAISTEASLDRNKARADD